MKKGEILVIGAGLAGTEAAWQIANAGCPVTLVEMRPKSFTPAHHSSEFGELVCSNSFGSLNPKRAAGLLHQELREFNSLIIKTADNFSIPAGGALAVDRSIFSKALTDTLSNHPLITIRRLEQVELPPKESIAVLATGPLTSNTLALKIKEFTGLDACHFFDAASPIIYGDSINYDVTFKASRYDKGDPAYLNCPLNETQYIKLRDELVMGEQATLKDFDKASANYFEGCLPIEEIARRGLETMRYGPLKAIGLWNPLWGDLYDKKNRLEKRPYAIAQLRQEDNSGKLFNMVGFQTNLKWSEQKRIFRLIPGLENAEFVRFGVMHRNTFLDSPKLLMPTLQFSKRQNMFAAGQITGTEGYSAAAAGGLLAGINAAFLSIGKKPIIFPPTSMIGSLINFISNRNITYLNQNNKQFQPMPPSFGLIPELNKRIRDKELRYQAYKERSLKDIKKLKDEIYLGN